MMHQYFPDFDRNVHCVLGLPFDVMNLTEASTALQQAAKNRTPCFLSTPNLNFLVSSRRDVAFRQSVLHSNLSVADGMPIVWLARLMGIPMPQRVAGSDLFEELRKDAAHPLKVYFFGGLPGIAQAASNELNADGGSMRSVGYSDPGFVPVQDMGSESTLLAINQSAADFLVVALGAGKGQAWIEKYKSLLNVPIISHLGAVVNFVAGTVHRAPRWMQKCGLEWLWRILEEPSLWKRYWNDGIGLLRYLVFNVPAARMYLMSMRSGKQSSLAVSVSPADKGLSIALQGDATQENLGPLKEVFRKLPSTPIPLEIDLAQTTRVDSAFLGLLLLLKAHRSSSNGAPLKVSHASSAIQGYMRAQLVSSDFL